MALREYTDAAGVSWQVWHVVPTTHLTAPVLPNDRRRLSELEIPEERRRRGFTLTPGMEGGWLCFESRAAKKRLAPVPSDWESCDEATLAGYLASASAVSRRIIDGERAGQFDASL